MSNMDSRDAPDVSLFYRDSGHRSINRIIIKSSEEFLKLLFELSLSLTIESFIDR
ncbi:hypothetical protein FOFC_20408 [Fusarium oxysporum]|nr:hypothetical protein FOFC_20408 [Fusarium oxysporum]